MDAQTVIESYVDGVAARLPRRQRNDVGLELRSLLTEELAAAAAATGRAPDEQLALQVVRDFGQPDAVAAHYGRTGFVFIESEHSAIFAMLSAIIVAVQWALTLPRVFASRITFTDWISGPGLHAFSWVGLLAVWFGLGTWIRRRTTVDPRAKLMPWSYWIFWLPQPQAWQPVDRKAEAQRMAPSLIGTSLVVTLFLVSPAWWLSRLMPEGTNTSWALYDEGFRRWMLPTVLALIAARLLMLVWVTLVPALWGRTESVRAALWCCFVALLLWALFGWHIFANELTNALFKAWLSIFVLINAIQLAVWIRKASLRVRVPEELAAPKSEPR